MTTIDTYAENTYGEMAAKAPRTALPWLGDRHDQYEAALGTAGAGVITAIYWYVATRAFNQPVTQLEIWSLVTSLVCVWLVRTENVWTMPTGIISCVLMGWFFFNIDLVGQAWLQIAFYIPISLVGWWAWCRGGTGRTELPARHLEPKGWILSVGIGLASWAVIWYVFHQLYGKTPYQAWDTSIAAASIVAQMLLTYKRAAHWLWWLIPVNVSAIGLYSITGAKAFAFLYVIYLANAWSGWRVWCRTIKAANNNRAAG